MIGMGPLALAASSAAPDGARLRPYEACYAIVGPAAEGAPAIGATFQSMRRAAVAGRRVWRVVVHQRLANGRFDMRDEFTLDANTLRPISLTSTRDGKPHAALTYAGGRVTGYRTDRRGLQVEVDQALDGLRWDGNLFGPTFAALPLAPGARFTVPYYQYDRGPGEFTVTVKGSERVDTPAGRVDAWVLDAGPNADERLEYLIAKRDRRELGYRAAQGGQRLGGSCAGLD